MFKSNIFTSEYYLEEIPIFSGKSDMNRKVRKAIEVLKHEKE